MARRIAIVSDGSVSRLPPAAWVVFLVVGVAGFLVAAVIALHPL
jgi:hypothetical protein